MLDSGTYAWQDPMAVLTTAMDRLESSRVALDIASSAHAALELAPETARLTGLDPLHREVLHVMAYHLGEALGAGRWLLAGYATPEMVTLMVSGILGAHQAGMAAPRLLEPQARAVPQEWRPHLAVTRQWLARSVMDLQAVLAAVQALLGPGWPETLQQARQFLARHPGAEMARIQPEEVPAPYAWPGRALAPMVEPGRMVEPARMVEPTRMVEPARMAEPGRIVEPGRIMEPGRTMEPGRMIDPARVPGQLPGRIAEPDRLPGPMSGAAPESGEIPEPGRAPEGPGGALRGGAEGT